MNKLYNIKLFLCEDNTIKLCIKYPCVVTKTVIIPLPKMILKDFSTKFLNHKVVVHHQARRAKYLLESIHVKYLDSVHAL